MDWNISQYLQNLSLLIFYSNFSFSEFASYFVFIAVFTVAESESQMLSSCQCNNWFNLISNTHSIFTYLHCKIMNIFCVHET